MKRRTLFKAAAALASAGLPASASAFGDEFLFTIGLLEYAGGNPNPRPGALQRLLLEVELTTSVLIGAQTPLVPMTAEAVFQFPILVLAGDVAFEPWSDDAREVLRTWLAAGGLLFVDSSEGRLDGEFERSVRRELEFLIPAATLEPIAPDHVLFRAFYLVDGANGRTVVSPTLSGAMVDDRLAVVFSPNDHMGAWARDNFGNYLYTAYPGGEAQRTQAHRFGVNLVMYAMCLDYKADQVHVEYLLRSRRWQVEP